MILDLAIRGVDRSVDRHQPRRTNPSPKRKTTRPDQLLMLLWLDIDQPQTTRPTIKRLQHLRDNTPEELASKRVEHINMRHVIRHLELGSITSLDPHRRTQTPLTLHEHSRCIREIRRDIDPNHLTKPIATSGGYHDS